MSGRESRPIIPPRHPQLTDPPCQASQASSRRQATRQTISTTIQTKTRATSSTSRISLISRWSLALCPTTGTKRATTLKIRNFYTRWFALTTNCADLCSSPMGSQALTLTSGIFFGAPPHASHTSTKVWTSTRKSITSPSHMKSPGKIDFAST